ncbi:hypothetical protein [Streptomyces sp. NPDC091371]|uniref:hypothetical protein n=1 Tax=Streptomyces sp. NPDC091371 TaxID=3155303 RepID=UPI003425D2F1
MSVHRAAVGAAVMAVLTAGALGLTTGTATADQGPWPGGSARSAPAVARAGSDGAQAAGLVYFNTVIDQWSHWTPDANASSHAGWLYRGRNYFKCYAIGEYYADNGRGSVFWLKTDDDTGHANVYVSDVYLDAYGWANDLNLLPKC